MEDLVGQCVFLVDGDHQVGASDPNVVDPRNDGIVDWRACLDPAAAHVEVRASHIGMAVDPRVGDQVLSALRSHREESVAASTLRVATA